MCMNLTLTSPCLFMSVYTDMQKRGTFLQNMTFWWRSVREETIFKPGRQSIKMISEQSKKYYWWNVHFFCALYNWPWQWPWPWHNANLFRTKYTNYSICPSLYYCSWQWPWPYANQFRTSYTKDSVCHLMKLSIDCHCSSFPWLIHHPSMCLTIAVNLSDPDLPPTRANALFHILIYMQTSLLMA